MVAVCETRPLPSVSSSFVSIEEFNVVRRNGSDSVRKHGCCLYVGNSLSFVQIEVGLKFL